MNRALRGLLSMVLLLGACRGSAAVQHEPVPSRAPRDAVRFDITAVTDSTVAFRADSAPWLRPGMTAYAVDPLQHDAFVARLALQGNVRGQMNALVTGQVRPVDNSHVVVVVRPAIPLVKTRAFWKGGAVGAVTGAVLAMLIR